MNYSIYRFRDIVLAFALAGLAVFTVIISGILKNNGVMNYSLSGFIIRTVFMTVIFAVMWIIPSVLNKIPVQPFINVCRWNRNSIIHTTALIFISRLPYLIAFYPGISNYDAISQLNDFFDGMNEAHIFLDDRNPVFDTIVFGGFVSVGKLLGSPNIGYFLFTIVQVLLCCIGFSLIICYMEKMDIPVVYRLTGLFYYMLVYFIGFFMMSMIKDAFHGMFFIFYYLVYVALCSEDRDDVKRLWIALIIFSILLALTKKAGLYQAVLYNLGLFIPRHTRKKIGYILASVFVPVIIVFVLLQGILFPITNIATGGSFFQREKYGFCFQQVAKAVIDNPEKITLEEKQIIDQVIEYNSINDTYDFNTIDPIKDLYRGEEVENDDINAFLGLYLQYMFKFPYSYSLAYFGVNGFYFSPKARIGLFTSVQENGLGIKNPDLLEPLRRGIMIFWDKIAMDGKNLLLNMVMFVFWIPVISLFRVFYFRKRNRMAALFPLFINILFLSFCPVALDRYAISQFYAVPMAFALGGCDEKQTESYKE